MAARSPNPYLAGSSPHSASQQQQPQVNQQQKQLPHHPYRRYSNENQSTRNQNAVMHPHQQHQQHQQHQPPAPKHNPYHNRTTKTAAVAPKTALALLQEHRASKSKRLYLLQRNNDNDVSKRDADEWMALENGIHELAGEAGTGKTQVALSLCMQAAITAVTATAAITAVTPAPAPNPVTNKKGCRAIYISLGKASMPKVLQRLSQMSEAWTKQNAVDVDQQHSPSNATTSTSTPVTPVQVLSRIMTRAVVNQDDLFDLLRHEMAALLEQETDCQVIVLDSVADLFRGLNHEVKASGGGTSKKQDDKNLAADRSATLFSLAAILKQFSDKYHIPIVVLNQVTARISNQPSASSSSSFSSSSAVLPALGLSWANCVNTSYILTRQETATGTGTAFVRRLSLRLSFTASCSQTACLQIETQGVRLVER
jgi:RecA/RadA recombinase